MDVCDKKVYINEVYVATMSSHTHEIPIERDYGPGAVFHIFIENTGRNIDTKGRGTQHKGILSALLLNNAPLLTESKSVA